MGIYICVGDVYGAEEVGCVQYFFSLAAGDILILFCFFLLVYIFPLLGSFWFCSYCSFEK